MLFGKPTTLQAVIAAMKLRINAITSIGLPYIIPTLVENWWEPTGNTDKYVTISNFQGAGFDAWETGGGNEAKAWDASCTVTLYIRLDLDFPGSDEIRLTNATMGVLAAWRLMLKALSQWSPDDGGAPAKGLLVQPARCSNFKIATRRGEGTIEWARISMNVSIPFVQDMS